MTLSVFLIVRNEEKNLPRALDSVKWADEIIIVDSMSTDRTVGVATAFTKPDKIFLRAFTDYADQKNFAMSRTTGDWLLSLDADEQVTPELAREIREAIAKNPSHAAFRIRRRSHIFGRWFKFTGTQDDKPTRLWKAGKAKFVQPIHEKVEVDGPVGTLKNVMNHYTYPDSREYMLRFNDYTSREAALLSGARSPSGFFELNVKPVLLFLKLYLWKLGFLDGEEGFIFSWLSATYAFAKHAKRRERERACV
jgi:glycosyltransferase involved in cell wall biosynthesis